MTSCSQAEEVSVHSSMTEVLCVDFSTEKLIVHLAAGQGLVKVQV